MGLWSTGSMNTRMASIAVVPRAAGICWAVHFRTPDTSRPHRTLTSAPFRGRNHRPTRPRGPVKEQDTPAPFRLGQNGVPPCAIRKRDARRSDSRRGTRRKREGHPHRIIVGRIVSTPPREWRNRSEEMQNGGRTAGCRPLPRPEPLRFLLGGVWVFFPFSRKRFRPVREERFVFSVYREDTFPTHSSSRAWQTPVAPHARPWRSFAGGPPATPGDA